MLVGDDAGTVLAAHPGRDKWLRKRFEANPLLTRAARRATTASRRPQGIDGMRRVFGFARLPHTNAFLAVGLDEAEMLRRVDREMRMAYLQFALIGAFVLFGVWFGGEHAIVRPLRSLARMAVHVGHGNLQIRTTRRRWAAEFAPLAGALDAMAHRLTEREEELRVANAQSRARSRGIDSLSGLANRRSFDAEARGGMAQQREVRSAARADHDRYRPFQAVQRPLRPSGRRCLPARGRRVAGADRRAPRSWRAMAARNSRCCSPRPRWSRALDIAENLRAAIEQLDLPHAAAPCGHVTASVGVAVAARRGRPCPRRC